MNALAELDLQHGDPIVELDDAVFWKWWDDHRDDHPTEPPMDSLDQFMAELYVDD